MDMLNDLLASQVDHSLVRKLETYTDRTYSARLRPARLVEGQWALDYAQLFKTFKSMLRELRDPGRNGNVEPRDPRGVTQAIAMWGGGRRRRSECGLKKDVTVHGLPS
jgi:hypothetical protein